MQQISQYQAAHKDSTLRAKELTDLLNDALQQRDQLTGDVKELHGKIEATVSHRDELQSNLANRENEDTRTAAALKKKDSKIFRLSQELENWQNRVPPLVERFRERDEEAKQVEVELADAHETISALREAFDADQTKNELADAQEAIKELQAKIDADRTRMEPADPDTLPGLDASNDQHAQTLTGDVPEFQSLARDLQDDVQPEDQIDPASFDPDAEKRDDLQKIKGVGPAIEKTLNELGIYRFQQISEMSEYDIDRVAQKLRGFRSRIYREDWIGQARLLRSQQPDNLN
jgi:predicted flap endonuclease-1-like 5' DNA nuclease